MDQLQGDNREAMPRRAMSGSTSVQPDQGNQTRAFPDAYRFWMNWQLPSASGNEMETRAFFDKNHQRILPQLHYISCKGDILCSISPEILFLVRTDGSFSSIIQGDLIEGKFILKSQTFIYTQAPDEATYTLTLESKHFNHFGYGWNSSTFYFWKCHTWTI